MSAFTKLNSARSPMLYTVTGALLGTMIFGSAIAVAKHKTITLDVDGEQVSLSTMSSSVRGAIESAGYDLDDRDVVAPAPDTSIADGDTVVLRQAREVSLTIDGSPRTVWTTALTVDEALTQLQVAGDVHVSASRGERLPLEGAILNVLNPVDVMLVDGAAPAVPVRLAAPTVGRVPRGQGRAARAGRHRLAGG